jgi:DUF4097 and DUF4098 domain-containing protein YvlB
MTAGFRLLAISLTACAALAMGCGHITIDGSSGVSIDSAKAKFTAVESRSIATGSAPQVVIDNGNGQISVTASAGSAVEVKATKHAAAAADLAKLVVSVDETGNVVHVRVDQPSPPIDNLWADLDVSVPAGASVQESTDDGDIKARGVSGTVTATTGNGDVALNGCTGHADAKTSSGQIIIDGAESPRAESGNGDISFTNTRGTSWARTDSGQIVVKAAEGNLDAESGNGDVQVSGFDGPVTGHTSSGSIRIKDGDGLLGLNTGNGDIRVDGGDHSAGVDADTESGSVHLDGPLSMFAAHTGNGDIDIRSTTPLKGACAAKTSSGDIRVSIPRSTLSLSFTETTASGDFHNSLTAATLTQSTSTTTGQLGNGADANLTLDSGNGDVGLSEE